MAEAAAGDLCVDHPFPLSREFSSPDTRSPPGLPPLLLPAGCGCKSTAKDVRLTAPISSAAASSGWFWCHPRRRTKQCQVGIAATHGTESPRSSNRGLQLGGVLRGPRRVRRGSGSRLSEQLDLGSMDVLNFVITLHAALGVEIPEADHPTLATLDGCADYMPSAPSSPGGPTTA